MSPVPVFLIRVGLFFSTSKTDSVMALTNGELCAASKGSVSSITEYKTSIPLSFDIPLIILVTFSSTLLQFMSTGILISTVATHSIGVTL